MFWIYVVENALTLALAPVLDLTLGEPGLALAWVGPYTVASILAVGMLRRRVGPLGGWLTIRALLRIVLASAATAAVVVALGLPFRGRSSDAVLVGRLIVQAGAGAFVYLYLAKVIHIRELRPVMAMARRMVGWR
jgi:peptidoglycan biosynthesis protein MviN/MurJ (putative lipid II flippase)